MVVCCGSGDAGSGHSSFSVCVIKVILVVVLCGSGDPSSNDVW